MNQHDLLLHVFGIIIVSHTMITFIIKIQQKLKKFIYFCTTCIFNWTRPHKLNSNAWRLILRGCLIEHILCILLANLPFLHNTVVKVLFICYIFVSSKLIHQIQQKLPILPKFQGFFINNKHIFLGKTITSLQFFIRFNTNF